MNFSQNNDTGEIKGVPHLQRNPELRIQTITV